MASQSPFYTPSHPPRDCTHPQSLVLQFRTVFSSFLRMHLLNPLRVQGMLRYLPQFIGVFWRLMHDRRVSFLTKMTPVLGIMMLITPPAIELDFIPIIGELDWLLVIYFSLKLFIWMCPADVVREHVAQVARGA
jgi:hypothetical protein